MHWINHFSIFQKSDSYRIYIVAMYSIHARLLMCRVCNNAQSLINKIESAFLHASILYAIFMQAYEQEIFYPHNLFLFYGWYSDNWWVSSDSEGLSCSQEQRERVISSGLAVVQDESLSDCSKNTGTGIVS